MQSSRRTDSERTPTISSPPAGAQIGKDRLGRVLERYWVSMAGVLRRYSILLGGIWSDGVYLTAWPRIATAAPLVALAAGLIEGATHWSVALDLADLTQPNVPTVTFVQMVPFLMLVSAVGALSTNLSLWLALGFAIGDFVIAGPQAVVSVLPDNAVLAVVAQRGPMLIGYALLWVLAVVPTITSERLLVGVQRLVHGRAMEAVMVRAGIMAIVQATLVYAWSLSAPVIIRILWSAVGSIALNQGITSIQVPGGWLAAAAVIAALARGWLVYQAYQTPLVAQRAARLSRALTIADGRPRFTRRLPPMLRMVLSAAGLTLFLAGLASNLLEGLVLFLYITLLFLARTVLPHHVAPWATWARLVGRVPLPLRLIVGAIVTYLLAQTVLSAPLPVVFNDDTGSFQPVLVSVCASLLVMTVLLARPPASARARVTRGVRPRS